MIDLETVQDAMTNVIFTHELVWIKGRNFGCTGPDCRWRDKQSSRGGGGTETRLRHAAHLSTLLVSALAALGTPPS